MDYFHQPPPGGLRQRAIQPLSGRDGSCPLIFDLERHRLIEVPSEFQFHAAMALDTGNLDDDLIGWLANEDLLTYANRPAEPRSGWSGPVVGDGPLSRLDRVFVFDDEIHCRLGGLDGSAALSVVRSVISGREAGSKVVFHLDDDGLAEGSGELPALVSTVRRAAGGTQRIGFELITDGRVLTPALVRFLADHDFTVCLTTADVRALDLLLAHMPERFVLSVVLDTGDHLGDLWDEARKLHVRRFDAAKITDKPFARLSLHALELRRFRRDLFKICDDMFDELAAGRQPTTVYEPLARVIGRQLAGRRPDGRPYLGVLNHGEMFPFFGPPPDEDAAGSYGDEEDVDGGALATTLCESCWARQRCTRGLLAGPAADPHRPEPRADRCEFWRAEVEVGLLFFHRLQQADPAHLLGFAEGREERVLDPYVHLGLQELKTC